MQGIVWILVGEGGLATTLTIEIATDVQLIDRVQGITTKIPQSFLLPYLWRFRASPQGLKGHTNEMKLLVTRIGDDPIPSGSKPDVLPNSNSRVL